MSSPIRLAGLSSGLDTEALVSALTSNYKTKVQKYEKAKTKSEWKTDKWKNLNTKVYSLYTKASSMRFSSAYSAMKATSSDTTKAKVSATSGAPVGSHSLSVDSLAKAGSVTGAQISAKANSTLADLGFTGGSTTIDVNGTSITVDSSTTMSSLASKLSSAGVQANYDENNGRMYINSKTSGVNSSIKLSASDDAGKGLLSKLGLTKESGATFIDGQDSKITLDGVDYTGTSNSFSVNGLTIEALGVTSSDLSVTTATDTQALYDTVKNFLSEYNDVINELATAYYADSAKGYEPLTDDEKATMSDKQVEEWEDKIKTSLLRSDSTLGGIIDTMTSAMSSNYSINGKNYSLSSFGIGTLGVLGAGKKEQYALHINGDADDSSTSGAKDKLMTALTTDPDTVLDFMKELSSKLYNNLDGKMKMTSLRSAYMIYNDKQMTKEQSDYTALIKEWNSRLTDAEDAYYKKFTSMESTLSKLNSNSSSLSGMF